jgi:hypothetical protein
VTDARGREKRRTQATVHLLFKGYSYYSEGDVQKGFLPGDPRPFLVPKRVVTMIETDKGKIVLTNEHTLAAKK